MVVDSAKVPIKKPSETPPLHTPGRVARVFSLVKIMHTRRTYEDEQRDRKQTALLNAADHLLRNPKLRLKGRKLKQYKKKYAKLERFKPRPKPRDPVNAHGVYPASLKQSVRPNAHNPAGTPKQTPYQRTALPRQLVDGSHAALGEATHQPVGPQT